MENNKTRNPHRWIINWPALNRRSLMCGLFMAFAVSLVSLPFAGATQLVNGEKISETISTPGEQDTHTFFGTAGESIQIRMAALDSDTTGLSFGPMVSLYDPNGVFLVMEGENVVSHIDRTLTVTGTYTVVAEDQTTFHDKTGDYDLYFVRAPGANEGGGLINGGVRSETIDLGDLDSYTFTGNAGDYVQIRVAALDSDTSGLSFGPAVSLYDPSGTFLLFEGENVVSDINRTLTATGTYTVVIADQTTFHDKTGNYDVYFVRVPGANEGGSLTTGNVRSDIIDLGDLDSFVFTGTANEVVNIQVTDTSSSDFFPIISLYGPTGVWRGDGTGDTVGIINRVLPASGTYTVIVADGNTFPAQTGSYDLECTLGCGSAEIFPPPIVTPSPGTTLTSTTVEFIGGHTSQDAEHWLYIGTSEGASNLHDSGSMGTAHVRTASGLTTSGTIYVRYWTRNSSGWFSQDHTYIMNVGTSADPEITTPTPGSTLAGATETFVYTANGQAVEEWWLYVGTSVGGNEYHNQGSGTVPNQTVMGLPTNGSTLHVRLWYKISGAWQSRDYTYTAHTTTGGGTDPEITTPTPGSTLAGATETFVYTANGQAVEEWWLYVGTSVGGNEYHNQGSGTVPNQTVMGLPTNGSTLHVRLWYKISGAWQSRDYTYTAHTTTGGGTDPEITTPTPGSTLAGGTETFVYTANGQAVEEWWLYVGTSVGEKDLHNSGSLGTATSQTVTGLPTNSSAVHVRLWYKISGTWLSRDFVYTAS